MSIFRGFFNRALNRAKSTTEIETEIAQRGVIDKPTKQLEDELTARASETKTSSELESEKASIRAAGGWTGPTNRAINRTLSTSVIDAKIADRRGRGLPTKQLEDERASRSDED